MEITDKDYEGLKQLDPKHESRFNGTVDSDDGPIKVKQGIATVDGQMFFVSDDGQYVADNQGNLVAIIQNGKVMEVTPEIMDQLTQQGILKGQEEEQPTMASPMGGVAPQQQPMPQQGGGLSQLPFAQ